MSDLWQQVDGVWKEYFSKKIPRKAIEELLEAFGDGSEASDKDFDVLIKIFYIHREEIDLKYFRDVANICEDRSGDIKALLVETIGLAEEFELEDIVYRWKEEESSNERYQKAVQDYEERKARGLNVPLSTALLALNVTYNVSVNPTKKKDVDYIVDNVISKYKGEPREREFKKWLKENWNELNPYPRIGYKKPRWIQDPEWPFNENGKPMMYVGQIDVKKSKYLDEETSYYLFTDIKSGEFKVVMQMY
jgi:hypothetical protein